MARVGSTSNSAAAASTEPASRRGGHGAPAAAADDTISQSGTRITSTFNVPPIASAPVGVDASPAGK